VTTNVKIVPVNAIRIIFSVDWQIYTKYNNRQQHILFFDTKLNCRESSGVFAWLDFTIVIFRTAYLAFYSTSLALIQNYSSEDEKIYVDFL
jgi:hypothetical protein